MSISLSVEKYCSDCQEFEADVSYEVAEDMFGNSVFVSTVVSCAHRHKCKRMMEHLMKEKKDEKDEHDS